MHSNEKLCRVFIDPRECYPVVLVSVRGILRKLKHCIQSKLYIEFSRKNASVSEHCNIVSTKCLPVTCQETKWFAKSLKFVFLIFLILPSVGKLSVVCWPGVSQLWADCWPTVGGGKLFFIIAPSCWMVLSLSFCLSLFGVHWLNPSVHSCFFVS